MACFLHLQPHRESLAGGGTLSQKIVDIIKLASPTSVITGIVGGVQGYANPGTTSNIYRIGPESRALSGTKEFFKGLLGSGVGKIGAFVSGVGIGAALTVLGDSTIGREAYLREAIEECNKGIPNATGQVEPRFFQVLSSNIEAIAAYVAQNSLP